VQTFDKGSHGTPKFQIYRLLTIENQETIFLLKKVRKTGNKFHPLKLSKMNTEGAIHHVRFTKKAIPEKHPV